MKKKKAAFLSKDETFSLVQECVKGANGERDERRRISQVFEHLVKDRGVTIEEVSIKALFESIVDPDNVRESRDDSVDMTSPQAVAEAVVSTAFPTVFNNIIFPTIFDAYTVEVGDVFKLVTELDGMNVPKTNIPVFVGYEEMEKVQEREKYPEDELPERFTMIKTHKLGKIVSLTLEFLNNDQTAMIAQRAKNVGYASAQTMRRFVTQKAFGFACTLTGEAATANLVVDGTAYAQYSADHSSIDGQTNNNISTTAFGTTGINNLRKLLRGSITDPRGNRIVINPRQLVVPPALWQQAMQLLNSIQQYDTAENAINPFAKQYELIELTDLGSDSLYYLGDFARETWFLWDWRPKMETQGNTSEQAFERDVISRHKFSAKCGCGKVDHRFSARGGQ